MHIGKGAAPEALACQASHSGKAYQGRIEQAIAVRTVAQGVVDPPVVRGEGPTATARSVGGRPRIGGAMASGIRRLRPNEQYRLRMPTQGRGWECRIP